jgi:hypothetical protein
VFCRLVDVPRVSKGRWNTREAKLSATDGAVGASETETGNGNGFSSQSNGYKKRQGRRSGERFSYAWRGVLPFALLAAWRSVTKSFCCLVSDTYAIIYM